jgi:hypothetical protein
LLVPEATSVDITTLQQLASASPGDYYLSNISPLGVPFNSFRKASSETQRLQRIDNGKPGSPCTKKYLISNTEFSEMPICTASRKYQQQKIKQLNSIENGKEITNDKIASEIACAVEKDCLCEGLSVSALLCNDIAPVRKLSNAVTICPGPNLAYFSGVFTLKQMVDFIYGRANILNNVPRSNMFVNELTMYVAHFKTEIAKSIDVVTVAKARQLKTFKENLLKGIEYYQSLSQQFIDETANYIQDFKDELVNIQTSIQELYIPS